MCGIVGILLADRDAAVNQELYDGLTMLQHRGQDAAGMVVGDKARRMHIHKDCGLVRDVFKLQHMIKLLGFYGIAHCRYPTAGNSSNVHEAQPFVTHIPFGLCIAHNGNLTNTKEMQQELCHRYHVNTDRCVTPCVQQTSNFNSDCSQQTVANANAVSSMQC
eukprot:TRINITY_DN5313_c0_g1_i1.p1 TRINITY_DN5313_c0_g1~~TRINITY_DN5313_c0_g1_i1.p1  ORF type:complete len:162 (+),score=49.86 TRINITY_DN5313_c0_g1_i1:56-541(+)